VPPNGRFPLVDVGDVGHVALFTTVAKGGRRHKLQLRGLPLVAKYATNCGMTKKTAFAEYRKSRNLTIDEVAAQFDVDRTTIIRWEKGAPNIPVKRLNEAERITGIPRQKLRPDIFGPASETAA